MATTLDEDSAEAVYQDARADFLDSLSEDGSASSFDDDDIFYESNEPDDETAEEEVPEGQQPGGRRTATQWKALSDRPVWQSGDETGSLTVLQAAFTMLKLKEDGKIHDGTFDSLCRFISSVLLPAGNLFPPSLHVCTALVGAAQLEDYQHHICINGCHYFGHLPKQQWKQHLTDSCPVCQQARFTSRSGARGNTIIQPRRVHCQLLQTTGSAAHRCREEGHPSNGHQSAWRAD
ncbi:hypothetical protein WJX73_006259 [Symbiochloris irregularis]|uniref:Uncharacterized protein n=1 Tax=Symbiochloris irregularis TaxID=706552 RepID=A0AAW1NQX0_9CHLO